MKACKARGFGGLNTLCHSAFRKPMSITKLEEPAMGFNDQADPPNQLNSTIMPGQSSAFTIAVWVQASN